MKRSAILTFAILALAASALPARAAAFDFLPGEEGFSASLLEEGGQPATGAGSHPLSLTFKLGFETGAGGLTDGDVRDLSLELPPGLIENPNFSRQVRPCSEAEFNTPRDSPWEDSMSGESCKDGAQVGVVGVRSSAGGGTVRTFGLFNLTPPPGAPSELGFNAFGEPVVLVPSIRQADGEYGITLRARNVSQLFNVSGLTLTIWGTPWSVLHNFQRGNCLEQTGYVLSPTA